MAAKKQQAKLVQYDSLHLPRVIILVRARCIKETDGRETEREVYCRAFFQGYGNEIMETVFAVITLLPSDVASARGACQRSRRDLHDF